MTSAAQSISPTISSDASGGSMLSDAAETRARIHQAIARQDKITLRIKRLRSEVSSGDLPEDTKDLPVIQFPQFRTVEGRPTESLAALQEWEGLVTEVREGVMIVELAEIANRRAGREEHAEIPLAEVSREDQHRVVPGALFRWVIGYTRKSTGKLSRTSLIYFRRLPQRFESIEVPTLVFAPEND
jgi:hypothetical protein